MTPATASTAPSHRLEVEVRSPEGLEPSNARVDKPARAASGQISVGEQSQSNARPNRAVPDLRQVEPNDRSEAA